MSVQKLQDIMMMYGRYTQSVAQHPKYITQNDYNLLLLLRSRIADFLNTAFAQNSSLQAALHEIASKLPLPAELAYQQKQQSHNFILPPSIPLPHHVCYAEDPVLDPCSLKRYSLVRTSSGLKIIEGIEFSAPILPQDLEFLLKKQPNDISGYYSYLNKVISEKELDKMRPVNLPVSIEQGQQRLLPGPQATPENQKELNLALRAPMQRSLYRLCCGVRFICSDVTLKQPRFQYDSPFNYMKVVGNKKQYNYCQVQPLYDPFEDLIVSKTTGFCAYFDVISLRFELGKVLQQPTRTNRFHYLIQQQKFKKQRTDRPILTIMSDLAENIGEPIYVYSKFVCSLIGCQNMCDDVLLGLSDSDNREEAREQYVRRWIEGLVGRLE